MLAASGRRYSLTIDGVLGTANDVVGGERALPGRRRRYATNFPSVQRGLLTGILGAESGAKPAGLVVEGGRALLAWVEGGLPVGFITVKPYVHSVERLDSRASSDANLTVIWFEICGRGEQGGNL